MTHPLNISPAIVEDETRGSMSENTVVRTPLDPKLDLLARVEALEEEVAAIYRTFNRMLGWKS